MKQITPSLVEYVNEQIIPLYDTFDKAHRRDHVDTVIEQSLFLANHFDVNIDMVYAIAAYHDVGLSKGREKHHLYSSEYIKADKRLVEWFSQEQIACIAQAAEEHRASSATPPHTLYGKIVAEADRIIDPTTIVRRTIQYGLSHHPQENIEWQFERMVSHLREKYGKGGYLKLWFSFSTNGQKLEQLQEMIDAPDVLKKMFEEIYMQESDCSIG